MYAQGIEVNTTFELNKISISKQKHPKVHKIPQLKKNGLTGQLCISLKSFAHAVTKYIIIMMIIAVTCTILGRLPFQNTRASNVC